MTASRHNQHWNGHNNHNGHNNYDRDDSNGRGKSGPFVPERYGEYIPGKYPAKTAPSKYPPNGNPQ